MIEVRADQASFHRVARALADEADGRQLRADLADGLYEALRPAQAEVRGAVLGMSAGGLAHAAPMLRPAVAAAVDIDIRIGGSSGGARLRATKRGMPRQFFNAPKRLNARRGWRRQVYGGAWVQQGGEPGWFDDTTARGHSRYRRAAEQALDRVARRIARRT